MDTHTRRAWHSNTIEIIGQINNDLFNSSHNNKIEKDESKNCQFFVNFI